MVPQFPRVPLNFCFASVCRSQIDVIYYMVAWTQRDPDPAKFFFSLSLSLEHIVNPKKRDQGRMRKKKGLRYFSKQNKQKQNRKEICFPLLLIFCVCVCVWMILWNSVVHQWLFNLFFLMCCRSSGPKAFCAWAVNWNGPGKEKKMNRPTTNVGGATPRKAKKTCSIVDTDRGEWKADRALFQMPKREKKKREKKKLIK